MSSTTAQQRAEECRDAVLAFLAHRFGLAYDIPAITRALQRTGGAFDEHEVADAALLLAGLGYLTESHHALGATHTYQCTSAGKLFLERN